MFKVIGFVLAFLLGAVIFFAPAQVRDFMNNSLYKNSYESKEEQVIGTVYGYNPRVAEIQEILKDAGFEASPVDGIMGKKTRSVIKEFQKKKELKPTGKIDSKTYLALNKEKIRLNDSTKEKIEEELAPFIFENKPIDMKIEKEPIRSTNLQDAVIKIESPKVKAKQIQLALKKAGFYPGSIDGKIGKKTKIAIKVFQRSKGLKADGIIGLKTQDELNKYLKD